MGNVMASAAEAETGALFLNAQAACPIRVALEEMGYPQPPTPFNTDNQTAQGIVCKTIKQKRSKAIDMRFYWLQDRVEQGQFVIIWRRGETNLADYFTKHHSPAHHKLMRPVYLHTKPKPTAKQAVCEGVLNLDSPQTACTPVRPPYTQMSDRTKRVQPKRPLKDSLVRSGKPTDTRIAQASDTRIALASTVSRHLSLLAQIAKAAASTTSALVAVANSH